MLMVEPKLTRVVHFMFLFHYKPEGNFIHSGEGVSSSAAVALYSCKINIIFVRKIDLCSVIQ